MIQRSIRIIPRCAAMRAIEPRAAREVSAPIAWEWTALALERRYFIVGMTNAALPDSASRWTSGQRLVTVLSRV
jgi:hypothetical protein